MKFFLRLLFLVCSVVGFAVVNAVLQQKDDREIVVRDFFFGEHPADAYDVIAFGPSYVYCTVNPVQLYRDTGLRSFVPGTSVQPIEMTYHYVRMALRKYRPQLIVVGTSMLVFRPFPSKYPEGFAHMATDPFPLGQDKIQMLGDQRLEDPVEDYLFPFLKYHSRWKNLGKRDLGWWHLSPRPECGRFMGFQLNSGLVTNKMSKVNFAKRKCAEVYPDNLMYLEKIVELCKTNGVQLLLFNGLRAGALADGRLAGLHRYARERKLDFLDLNEVFDQTGISNQTDFHDKGHLNIRGAEKATRYLGRYIQDHYSLKVCQDPDERGKWDALCREYDEVVKQLMPPPKPAKQVLRK